MALTRLYPTDLLGTLLMDDDALHSLPHLPAFHWPTVGHMEHLMKWYSSYGHQSLGGLALAFLPLLLLPVTCFMSALSLNTSHLSSCTDDHYWNNPLTNNLMSYSTQSPAGVVGAWRAVARCRLVCGECRERLKQAVVVPSGCGPAFLCTNADC